jgi:serine/threonine protein kinase
MGEVYRAQDARLNRAVAIKILPPGMAQDADRLRRFEQEARAAGSLNHPNILVVYDFGQREGTVFVVTELLEGQTLRERIAESALPVRKALEYAAQAARGLSAAHAKGITHRDIKPENLFVTNDGFVKILDFGLAKQVAPGGGDKTSAPTAAMETDPGVIMGTVAYMAPEQVRGMAVDPRSDIFSLGVVLYEMLAGKRPFAGVSSIDTMSAILKEEAPDLPATVPPGLEGIVRRCLEKRPEDRFESARDLAFALESVSSGSGRDKPLRRRSLGLKPLLWTSTAAAAVILAFFAGRTGNRPAVPEFHRVTYRHGVVPTARFANDGKTIIYAASWDGKPFELFSTQEGSPESRPLGIQNAIPVSISKNGEMALILSPVMRWAETPGTLAKAPVSGGAPREIANDVFMADWAPDGRNLAVIRGTAALQWIEYPIGKKIFQGSGSILSLSVSPKGDKIAFIDNPFAQDPGGYFSIIDTNGGNKISSRRWNLIQGVAWSPDGTEAWFTAGQQGYTTQIYAMDLRGRERMVLPLPGAFWLSEISADGRALLGQQIQTSSIFMHRRGSPETPDLYWHDMSILYDLSSDGEKVLFMEGGDAAYSSKDWPVYVRKTDGSSPALQIGEGYPTALSPDGNSAMVAPRGNPAQLLAVPVHAGDPRPLTADRIHHLYGRWLPDGRRIAFVGSEPGHGQRYYVQDSREATPKPISGEDIAFDRNLDDIVISRDGRTLAVAMQDQSMRLLPIDGGESRVVRGGQGLTPVALCGDGSLLAYRSGEMPAKIMRVDPATGRQELWKELAPTYRAGLWEIQPVRVASDCETYGYSAQYLPETVYVVSGLR